MKKVFLVLLVLSSLFAKSQIGYIVRDKIQALKSIQLKDVVITGYQKDTVFVGDNQLPTSKAVRDFVLGRLAAVNGGSGTSFDSMFVYLMISTKADQSALNDSAYALRALHDTLISGYLMKLDSVGGKPRWGVDSLKLKVLLAAVGGGDSSTYFTNFRADSMRAHLYAAIQRNIDSIAAHNNRLLSNTTAIASKQDALVSGTNIKTINGAPVLGSGNLIVTGVAGVAKAYAPLIVNATGDSITQRYNVKVYGAKGDGTTNDTRAIQLAINACVLGGGGTVFFPIGTYLISDTLYAATSNSQLYIPYAAVTSPARVHVTLEGESKPNFTVISGGWTGGGTGIPVATGTVILKSTLTGTSSSGAAVIGTSPLSGTAFNYNYLSVENISIQVKNNPSGTGPIVGGINYSGGASLQCKNVTVYIDTAGLRSVLPLNDVTGIQTPNPQSESSNLLENTIVIGMKSGYKLSEHVVLINAQAFVCYYAFNIVGAAHPITGLRTLSQWNAYDMYFTKGGLISNWNLDIEYQAGTGNWFDNINSIKDSANAGIGTIFYTERPASGAGALNAAFTKSGGANLQTLSHAEGIHPVIGQVVGGSNPNSLLFTDPLSKVWSNNSKFSVDTVNTKIGLNNPTPAYNLDISNPGSAIRVNTTSNALTGYLFAKSGANKWQFGMDNAGSGTADLFIYDFANAKPRLLFGTAGTVNIGGNAVSAAGAAIAIDNSNNVTFDNGSFTWDAANHWARFGTLYGGATSSGNLSLSSTTNATKGSITFGTKAAFIESTGRLGIGTVSPSAEIEVKTSTDPTILMNPTTPTGAARFKFQKNGIDKWAIGMDKDGNATADFYFYDYANAKIRYIINTSGTMSLGGDAQSTPTITLSATGSISLQATNTATGTTGAQTINKPSGKVNFAPGASSLVVTNSLVTTGSIVHLQVEGNDATMKYATVTLSAGSFTITGPAATAETKVSFSVINQ